MTVARDWESVFSTWGSAPSPSEQEKCDRAVVAIRKAIAASEPLSQRSLKIFAQGSYRNRTNVRAESDVDVCVCCSDTIFFDLRDELEASDVGLIVPASYSFDQFKDEVAAALVAHFGRDAVVRGKKAFDIHENTYRISADVIPCFKYREYWKNGTTREGTAFYPDGGERIENYPEQHYDEGVAKNSRVDFKTLVRVLKNLRNEMKAKGHSSAEPIPSFFIESLVWNVPDEGFANGSRYADVRWIIAHLFNGTREDATCSDWTEVNAVKYLFRRTQPWNRTQANAFLWDAWSYVGFE